MRKLTTFLVIASLLVVGVASAMAATKRSPWKVGTKNSVSIKRGDSVRWTWADSLPHNVKGPGFRSRTIAKRGFTFTRRFRKAGRFRIICEVHPTSMRTIVRVG